MQLTPGCATPPQPLALAPAWLATPAQAADTAPATAATAAQPKANWYPKRVDAAFVKPWAVVPKRDGATLVDSRPTARKYDLGHIPTAVNIPDLQFDKLAPTLLPADKAQLLIFYCDGVECALSHNSAFKAEKLGYTNVHVYAEGYPDWLKNGNLGAVSVAYRWSIRGPKSASTTRATSLAPSTCPTRSSTSSPPACCRPTRPRRCTSTATA